MCTLVGDGKHSLVHANLAALGSAQWSVEWMTPKHSLVQKVKRCVLSSNCMSYTMVQNQILWNHVLSKRFSKLNQFAPPLLPVPLLVGLLSVFLFKRLIFPQINSRQTGLLDVSQRVLTGRMPFMQHQKILLIFFQNVTIWYPTHQNIVCICLSDKTNNIINKIYLLNGHYTMKRE